jgi:hypothetical protein
VPPEAPTSAGLPPSDADRDRLAAALGEHYAAGRIALEELDVRLQRVLAATSVAHAVAALDGLDLVADAPTRRRGRRGRHGERDQPQPGWVPTLERFRRAWPAGAARKRRAVLGTAPVSVGWPRSWRAIGS